MNLLIVSHQGVAAGMKSAAEMILGDLAKNIKIIELTEAEGVEKFSRSVESQLKRWKEKGENGIVFSDLKGGTPCNKAEFFVEIYGLNESAAVISGVNLPMLIEAVFLEKNKWDFEFIQNLIKVGQDGVERVQMECMPFDEDE